MKLRCSVRRVPRLAWRARHVSLQLSAEHHGSAASSSYEYRLRAWRSECVKGQDKMDTCSQRNLRSFFTHLRAQTGVQRMQGFRKEVSGTLGCIVTQAGLAKAQT